MKRSINYEDELGKLENIFHALPESKFKVAHGLIFEAARLRELLARLWDDIEEHGTCDMFTQSPNTPPFAKERPQVRELMQAEKNYLAIMKQLVQLLPPEERAQASIETRLNALMEGAEHEH